jgi:DNA topoisomerase-1
MKEYVIRKKDGKNFKYYDKYNNILSKNKIDKYLDFYIPPAYDNVKINLKKGKVRAIGYDDKNRPQYIYNKKYTEKQSTIKFSKLINFGKNYKQIRDRILKDINSISETREKQIATILMLIIECDFRIGNDKYAKENNSYGVTTLEKRHFKTKSGKLEIDFIGKKGVRNKCVVKNKNVIKNLKTKKRTIKKNDRNYTIKSNDVNNYIKKLGNWSSKYFRTWSANISLINNLNSGLSLKESIEKTAYKLHHTPAICKKNYLDSKLIKFYEKNQKKFLEYFKGDKNEKYYKFLKHNY